MAVTTTLTRSEQQFAASVRAQMIILNYDSRPSPNPFRPRNGDVDSNSILFVDLTLFLSHHSSMGRRQSWDDVSYLINTNPTGLKLLACLS